jgi:hypothetical protein
MFPPLALEFLTQRLGLLRRRWLARDQADIACDDARPAPAG